MKHYLIISAASNSGQKIIEAIRDYHQEIKDPQYAIIGTSSRDQDINQAHKTIKNIDITNKDSPTKIAEAINKITPNVDHAFFTFARGMVGFPTHIANPQEIQMAIEHSANPMVFIQQYIKPKTMTSLSGFVSLKPLLASYGAMIYAKYALEDIAIRVPEKFKSIRIGYFESSSSRGIMLLVQRNILRKKYPEVFAELTKDYDKNKDTFRQHFEQKAFEAEKERYQHKFKTPFRPTQVEDIKPAVKKIIQEKPLTQPIINVLGPWLWEENVPHDKWPEHMMEDDTWKKYIQEPS